MSELDTLGQSTVVHRYAGIAPARTGECRMCAALQAGQMGERSHCAEHAAAMVSAWNASAGNAKVTMGEIPGLVGDGK